MKKLLLGLFILPLLLTGCKNNTPVTESESFETTSIDHPRKTGDIGAFNLLSPANDFSTNTGFTFTWEEATNSDYYEIEIATTMNFVTDDEDEVYLRQSNIANPRYDLNFSLPTKDARYYWKVTAINRDHKRKCADNGTFYYESSNVGELEIAIEEEQDWVLHPEGSFANISIDRNDFFGTGKDSLAIVFDKEHTLRGVPSSDGWIVITKTEDRELYGTDSFYFNFYYSGHDATILVRVLDYDGEYWHQQVQVSNNAKQTIVMRYEDFTLRTAGTNIFNRKFDWQHIRYFEIVFERTFGDGICLFSDIKAVQFNNYKNLFMDVMDFKATDMKDWTYENYDFEKVISEDGRELTLNFYSKSTEPHPEKNPNGFGGFGFQNANLYKFFVQGDAIRMKVKYTGASSSANFFFRVLEEDSDRWSFKLPFSKLVQNEYKEVVIPLKAFQRTDYMTGDGAKQFFFIQKFNIGLNENYASGSLSVRDIEVIKIKDIVEDQTRHVGMDGCIDNFNNYDLYTEMYYYWDQSSVNKDEAMKLDTIHKAGGMKNTYCAEFDYKADMEMAVYQLYMETKECTDMNSLQLWLKDASVFTNPALFPNLNEDDVAAEMTIQLTMDSGEWYRYVIDKVEKEWNIYTIRFEDFTCINEDDLIDDPNPLSSDHIIHMAFGFKYLYYNEKGEHIPTYAIANPVYIDEVYFKNSMESSIVKLDSTIYPDDDTNKTTTIDTFENYDSSEGLFDWWWYNVEREYNLIELSNDVSSQGGSNSLKMQYKGSTSVAYARITSLSASVKARGMTFDLKGDGKATVYFNLYWRSGTTLKQMRYTITNIPTEWTHYEVGFNSFEDQGGTKTITRDYAKDIEYFTFGITNADNSQSYIYVDNIVMDNVITYSTKNITPIANS